MLQTETGVPGRLQANPDNGEAEDVKRRVQRNRAAVTTILLAATVGVIVTMYALLVHSRYKAAVCGFCFCGGTPMKRIFTN